MYTDNAYNTLLNAIPIPVFIVDNDVRIQDANEAAIRMVEIGRDSIKNRRGGEILKCLHANEVPGGCGKGSACSECVIRNSIVECLKGASVTRRQTQIKLNKDNDLDVLELLITISPLPNFVYPLALLIVEDVTEMSFLKEITPRCVHC